MIKRLWRWLFHRRQQPANRKQPTGVYSIGLSVLLDTDRRWRDACEHDPAIPAMAVGDIKRKRTDTAHITRIIDAKTRPLFLVDGDAPTVADDWDWFHDGETMRGGSNMVDQYATQKMELVEIMR